MATKGRLRRVFPAAAVSIPQDDFKQKELQRTLAETLSTMSSHAVNGMQPRVMKAGQWHDEDRDTTHPAMVTELLMGFLSAIGQPVKPVSVTKNTREEVRWKNTRSPWRRSATWLLIRIVLQLTLSSSEDTCTLYKEALLLTMCRIERHALPSSLHSDGLYMMNAKVARRVLKLGGKMHDVVSLHIQKATMDVHEELNHRWAIIQDQHSQKLDFSVLAKLDFQRDTLVSLPDLDAYINALSTRQSLPQTSKSIESPSLLAFSPGTLPSLSIQHLSRNGTYAVANLHTFEEWVASHCYSWAEARSNASLLKSTKDIAVLIQEYHRLATQYYAENPEALSNMLLTIFELWIACDRGVIAAISLLKDYEPGFDCAVLHNLLLPFKSQMERLLRIEEYLRARTSRASQSCAKLFVNVGAPDCFAVKYFDTCREQQTVLKQIRKQAQEQKEAKVVELHTKQQEHARLMDQYNRAKCETEEVYIDRKRRFKTTQHRQGCTRCGYKQKAGKISITVHEWPLPSNELKAKTVVFELRVPPLFASWRDTTLHFITDVLRARHSRGSHPRASYSLSSDKHLQLYIEPSSKSTRCHLLSEDKPHIGTHRKLKNAAMASENDVCLNNGLNYRFYDSSASTFIGAFDYSNDAAKAYNYDFPSCSQSLQQYIFRPKSAKDGPPPNKVIADQSDCPDHMSLEEYKELCNLPLGHRIQWYNLLLQLRAPAIDFRKDETALVVFQCIYQTGPREDSECLLRASHAAIEDENLAQQLIDSVNVALGRVKENWESAQSLCIFSATIRRLLSLSSNTMVQTCCLESLRIIRNTTFGWLIHLRVRLQKAELQSERTELRSKCADIALICALTFDVDDAALAEVLGPTRHTSILIQCSIIIQEAKKTFSKSSEPVMSILEHRYRKFMRRCCTLLCTSIQGLDDAIKEAWPAFQPSNSWTPLERREDQWVVTSSTASGFGDALTVHYNTLTGELLVNGLPLDRPPKKYEDHARWPVLFGRSAIEVMPTIIPGMQFSLKQMYQDYEVHVGMDATSLEEELVVQACFNGQTYTTVPSRLLEGHFATCFVDEFVHWYNHTDHTLEFRPRGQPWGRDPSVIWTLSKHGPSSKWQLRRQQHAVVRFESATTKEIGAVLQTLAKIRSIYIILNPLGTSIEIELPKLELGFSLRTGTSSLHSREFRGMTIDDDQSMQALTGFSSKLLLSPQTGGQRMVLVAEGPVSCAPADGHVKATVDHSSMAKVHPLSIDSLLGRLVDNGDLQCKLFLAYLHGLTSFCLPDSLTGKTGTEEALSILKSAAVQSFDQLSSTNVDALREIAGLAPGRAFYPVNEKVMQTVSFSAKVGPLAQHSGLFKSARSISRRAEKYVLFYPDSRNVLYTLPQINEHLLERDSIRSATFRVSGFGAEDHNVNGDIVYKARDTNQSSNQAQHAHVLVTTIYHNFSSRHWANIMPTDLLWAASEKAGSVTGVSKGDACLFKFDPGLIASGLDFPQWLLLHRDVKGGAIHAPNKFDLMMWLATLASYKDANLPILQIIALMHTTATVREETIPTVETCLPPQGYDLSKDRIEQIVRSHRFDVNDSPEADLEAKPDEDWETYSSRRNKILSDLSERQVLCVEVVTDRIWRQWPSSEVFDLSFIDQFHQPYDYIDVPATMVSVRRVFETHFNNLQLSKYFTRLQNTVTRLPARAITTPTWPATSLTAMVPHPRFVSLDNLLEMVAPILPDVSVGLSDAVHTHTSTQQFPRLSHLIEELQHSTTSAFEVAYVRELEESLRCLMQDSRQQKPEVDAECTVNVLRHYRAKCRSRLDDLYSFIFAHGSTAEHELSGATLSHSVTQWPRLAPTLLLQLLNRHHWPKLKQDWKKCIVEYGLAITAVQRADRLVIAATSTDKQDLANELSNIGHSNWNPHEHPGSLLLEIESAILIRPVQEEIAAEMRRPSCSRNAVMQLNMGEGKSSVIVPMVATSLADPSQLVRVIVAKPQSKQMWQMLVSKLGGLIDQRVRLMPFSRSLKLSITDADAVGELVRGCMSRGDVLLVQPEHILSFQLMVLECFDAATTQGIGRSLLETQLFFNKFSRDVVDESDENFSTRFELIYTMGTQRQIEFSPNRWICIQQVFDLVHRFAHQVAGEFPGCVEIGSDVNKSGSFPKFRILKPEAGDRLVELIATHICETGIDGFPIMRQAQSVRDAVHKYLVTSDLSMDEIANVEHFGAGSIWNSASIQSALLLLRGLLAGGILTFVFGQKRWRVNYGLVVSRTPPTQLAVPYRAKDNPSPRSEFSHPDVVLALTSLSYYYGGLTNEDLFTALKHLMRSDQADVEYGAWIADAPHMPPEFCNIEGINLKDTIQCTMDIFPHLKSGKAVIDYFLANIVFPKAMKEFPHKLSASGWDIGMSKAHPTTGFSGTNDSKTLLPLDVVHLDLPRQKHTNALVLDHILDPCNSVLLMRKTESTASSDAERLLDVVIRQEPPVQVILDVGAQILELDNQGLATRWLQMHPNAGDQVQAVVFVNDDDELSVLPLHGRVERLQTSSYASRLDECLIFLDEAHTRGIDLKLPKHYRAAVTLGADLTKDRLVQGKPCSHDVSERKR